MASGDIVLQRHYTGVELRKTASFTANQRVTVDFTTEINNNQPSGYTYHHIELLGAWPLSTWNEAFVIRAATDFSSYSKSIDLVSLSTQSYSVNVIIWYWK